MKKSCSKGKKPVVRTLANEFGTPPESEHRTIRRSEEDPSGGTDQGGSDVVSNWGQNHPDLKGAPERLFPKQEEGTQLALFKRKWYLLIKGSATSPQEAENTIAADYRAKMERSANHDTAMCHHVTRLARKQLGLNGKPQVTHKGPSDETVGRSQDMAKQQTSEKVVLQTTRAETQSGLWTDEGLRRGYPLCCVRHFALQNAEGDLPKRSHQQVRANTLLKEEDPALAAVPCPDCAKQVVEGNMSQGAALYNWDLRGIQHKQDRSELLKGTRTLDSWTGAVAAEEGRHIIDRLQRR